MTQFLPYLPTAGIGLTVLAGICYAKRQQLARWGQTFAERLRALGDAAELEGKTGKLYASTNPLERDVIRANAHDRKKLACIAHDGTLPPSMRDLALDLLEYASPAEKFKAVADAFNRRHPNSG